MRKDVGRSKGLIVISKFANQVTKSHRVMTEQKQEINQSIRVNLQAEVLVGEYAFDPLAGQLTINEVTHQLEPQISALLSFFVESAGDLLSKDAICQFLWAERVVSDDAFRAVIKKLRKALGDDARAPKYIQTIPLKGYRLIARVRTKPPQTGPNATRINKTQASLTAGFLIVATLLILGVMLRSGALFNKPPELTMLTELNGSEMNQSFNPAIQQLVFSHRENKDDYLQLYTMSLSTGVTTRLTFDRANYANGHLSPDGTRLAFTRSTPSTSQTFVADFSSDEGLSNIVALPETIGSGRYLQAWNANGDGLYLSDLDTPEASKGIGFYHLTTNTFSLLTDPGGFGRGDTFARESHDGRYIAVLRNLAPGEYTLVIQHLESGELVHQVALDKNYSQLVWNASDDEIVLSSFYSEFAQYSLSDKQLNPLDLDVSHVNDVFYHCGKGCVYARQHNGNYLNLESQPNPFTAKDIAFHQKILGQGAESLPVYGNNSETIYYATKYNGETQIVGEDNQGIQVLAHSPVDAEMSSLQVNTAKIDVEETHLAGIINHRLFVIELESGQLTYVTSGLEKVLSLYWDKEGGAIEFTRIEHDSPVLYRYELASRQKVRLREDYFARLPLSDVNTLTIDKDLVVRIETPDAGHRILTTLPNASSNRWKLTDDALYFTERNENLTYLNRIELATGRLDQHLLAKNRFRIGFDISKDEQSLISVRSVLAQSDTVLLRF